MIRELESMDRGLWIVDCLNLLMWRAPPPLDGVLQKTHSLSWVRDRLMGTAVRKPKPQSVTVTMPVGWAPKPY